MYRIHNQSTIHKDSDWTSSRAKEFIWSLNHLEEWVWRTASEECVWRNESEEELLKTRHQKQGHQKHLSSEAYLARSYFTRVDKDIVRSVRPQTLQPPSLQSLSLQQDKDNSNIAADFVPFVLEWIWIKFFIGQLSDQAKDQGWRIKDSKQDTHIQGQYSAQNV